MVRTTYSAAYQLMQRTIHQEEKGYAGYMRRGINDQFEWQHLN
jgi:hypothetical protein